MKILNKEKLLLKQLMNKQNVVVHFKPHLKQKTYFLNVYPDNEQIIKNR